LLSIPLSVQIEVIAPPCEAVDGVDLTAFHVGCVYDVDSTLAAFLVCQGWARPVEPQSVIPSQPLAVYRSDRLR
jgi:hypothetical protein